MLAARVILAPALLVLLILACGDTSPLAPSRTGTAPLAPEPVIQTWDITVQLTSVTGGDCVGDLLRSQIGAPAPYSLTATRTGTTVNATLTSLSGDYACTFSGGSGSESGFSFGPSEGTFTCEAGGYVRGFLCPDGRLRDLFAVGQNLFGRIAGEQIRGDWTAGYDMKASPNSGDGYSGMMETKAEYVGRRR